MPKEMREGRAYSVLDVKAVDGQKRIISGWATTPSPDREGDIVESQGLEFKNPLPLLYHHDSRQPIGTVTFQRPTKDGMKYTAQIASVEQDGKLKDRVDLAWDEITHGLIRGVSIGFRSKEWSWMESGGIHFQKAEVLELSVVTIPANADAGIDQIRSADRKLLAASGRVQPKSGTVPAVADRQRSSAPTGAGRTTMPTIAEQIAAFETERAKKAERQDAIMNAAMERGETLTADESEEYKALDTEIGQVDEHLKLLRARQERDAKTAAPVKPTETGLRVRGATPLDGSEAEQTGATATGRPGPIAARVKAPAGYGYVRMLAAKFIAREEGGAPAQIARDKGWGDDVIQSLRIPRDVITRAAVAPADTVDATWASPLVQYQNLTQEFIELLRPRSIIARIPGIRMVPFKIKVPRETTASTAYWVGEGSPKPLTSGAFDTVTLDFAKVAGITLQTMELMRLSSPGSERLLTDSLVQAITYLVDRDFLDPAKAASTGVSPASVTNGATSVTATGVTAAAFRSDLNRAMQAFFIANQSMQNVVIIMTERQAFALSMMENDLGAPEFPNLTPQGGSIKGFPVVTSENIVANGGSPADGSIIVIMKASDVLLADDGQVTVDVSTEATVQADSAPDSPATASTVMVSLWQRNLVGIRCERMINWTTARTSSVTYIAGANYSP